MFVTHELHSRLRSSPSGFACEEKHLLSSETDPLLMLRIYTSPRQQGKPRDRGQGQKPPKELGILTTPSW